jgi:hypothetical protein
LYSEGDRFESRLGHPLSSLRFSWLSPAPPDKYRNLDWTTIVPFQILPNSSLIKLSHLLYDWRFTAYQFVLRQAPPDSQPASFFFQLSICGYSTHVTTLREEAGSVVYKCCWPSLAKSFSGPGPFGLMTIYFAVSVSRFFQRRGARSPYLFPSRTG